MQKYLFFTHIQDSCIHEGQAGDVILIWTGSGSTQIFNSLLLKGQGEDVSLNDMAQI